MKYQQAKALAWAVAAPSMTPISKAFGTRVAGGRYNTDGAYSRALAKVCAEHNVECGPGQPSGDTTDYVRQPQCWVFEDRTVPCAIGPGAIIMPPKE